MIVDDLQNIMNNEPGRRRQVAQLTHIDELASVGDAHKVALMAGERDPLRPAD